MQLFAKKKDSIDAKAVQDLITEQRWKEAEEIVRRRWCIEQATCCRDTEHSERVIDVAEDIYVYVYGERT